MFVNLIKNSAITSALVLLLSVLVIFYNDYKETKERKILEEWSDLNKIILSQDNSSINDFKIEFDENEWNFLINKLNHTRYFPLLDEKYAKRNEYGFDSEYAKTLVEYWRTKYSWEKAVLNLNRHSQYKLVVNDGIIIHYLRKITNQHLNLKPIKLVMMDGWPGSVYSFAGCLDYIEANYKTLSFDIIVPSIPGYGYSTPLTKPVDAFETSQYFDALMRFVHNDPKVEYFIHGEDWGSVITTMMAKLYPNRVKGIHLTMPAVKMHDPITIFYGILGQISPKLILTHQELDAGFDFGILNTLSDLIKKTGYFHYQATKPDTLANAFTDSPVGLLAYLLEKYSFGSFKNAAIGPIDGLLEKFDRDELLTIVTYYWMTNSISSSMRFYKAYWQGMSNKIMSDYKVSEQVPVAVEYFKNEVNFYPSILLKRFYLNLKSFNVETKGGHFANFENCDLVSKDFVGFVSSVLLV